MQSVVGKQLLDSVAARVEGGNLGVNSVAQRVEDTAQCLFVVGLAQHAADLLQGQAECLQATNTLEAHNIAGAEAAVAVTGASWLVQQTKLLIIAHRLG